MKGKWVEFNVDSKGNIHLREGRVSITDRYGSRTENEIHWSQWNLLLTGYIGGLKKFTAFGGYLYKGMKIWSMCPLVGITKNNPMNFGNGDSDIPLVPVKIRMWLESE